MTPAGPAPGASAFPLGDLKRLQRMSAWLPGRWTAAPRRRRILFLALAAPGFVAVFTTPLHHRLAVLLLGLGLFAAAWLFRGLTEPLFIRAERAALWPAPRPQSAKDAQTHA